MGRVHAALDEVELKARLKELECLEAYDRIEPYAGANLLGAIRAFISQS
jgi:hypothetical protein